MWYIKLKNQENKTKQTNKNPYFLETENIFVVPEGKQVGEGYNGQMYCNGWN